MKRILVYLFVLIIMYIPKINYPNNSDIIGAISSVNVSKKEIIVKISNSSVKFKLGDRLYTCLNNQILVMIVKDPSLTVVKCKLILQYDNYYKKLDNGLLVYRYKNKNYRSIYNNYKTDNSYISF